MSDQETLDGLEELNELLNETKSLSMDSDSEVKAKEQDEKDEMITSDEEYDGYVPDMLFGEEFYHGDFQYQFKFLLEDVEFDTVPVEVNDGYISETEDVYSIETNKERFFEKYPHERTYFQSSDDDESNEDGYGSDEDHSVFVKEMDQFIYGFTEDYDILSILHNATHRKIYLVYEKATEKKRIISICRDDPCIQRHPETKEPREVYILRKLLGVSNVCQLLGWTSLGTPYYAILTPFYTSIHTLYQYVSLLTDEVQSYFIASIMKRLSKVLMEVHAQGVTHRDICFENICYDPVLNELVLIDFGASCLIHEHIFRNIGRNSYHAPEIRKTIDTRDRLMKILESNPKRKKLYKRNVIRQDSKVNYSYNESVDVWAMGILLFSLMYNEGDEVSANKVKQKMKELIRTRAFRNNNLVYMLCGLLKENPDERFTAAKAFEIASTICDIDLNIDIDEDAEVTEDDEEVKERKVKQQQEDNVSDEEKDNALNFDMEEMDTRSRNEMIFDLITSELRQAIVRRHESLFEDL